MAQLLKSHLMDEDIYESKKPQKMAKKDYLDNWADSRPVKTKKPTGRFITKISLKSHFGDDE